MNKAVRIDKVPRPTGFMSGLLQASMSQDIREERFKWEKCDLLLHIPKKSVVVDLVVWLIVRNKLSLLAIARKVEEERDSDNR